MDDFPSFGGKARAHGESAHQSKKVMFSGQRTRPVSTAEKPSRRHSRPCCALPPHKAMKERFSYLQGDFMIMSTGGLVNDNLQAAWK